MAYSDCICLDDCECVDESAPVLQQYIIYYSGFFRRWCCAQSNQDNTEVSLLQAIHELSKIFVLRYEDSAFLIGNIKNILIRASWMRLQNVVNVKAR